MELVTVTCNRDLNQMLLQAESIQRFVDPCTHWVIVNDMIINQKKWEKLLEPYYTNHKLNLIFANWKDYKHSGWHKHQIYKVLASRFVEDDYIALDSKNFFVKRCNLEEWRNIIGSGKIDIGSTKTEYVSASENIAKKYNTSVLTDFLSSETPFVFKYQVVRDAISEDGFFDWYNIRDMNECIFYSYLIKDELGKIVLSNKHKTIWKFENTLTYNELKELDITVFAIHRYFLEETDIDSLEALNKFLEDLGLKNKFKRRTKIDKIVYQIELVINHLFPNL
jgi:hypothetical protein